MKKLILIILVALVSCEQHDNDNDHENENGMEHEVLTLPDVFSYAGKKPVLGNNEMLETVIAFNEKISSKDPDMADLLADSVTLHLADGLNTTISSDSLQAMIGEYFTQYETIDITINAAIPVVYKDMNHNWVYSWVFEVLENKDGTTESHYLHEDFRLENGKIREVFQFKRIPGN